MKNRIFITGGMGFIGSEICRELVRRGDKPIVYDACLSFANDFDHRNVFDLRFEGIRDSVKFIRGDIRKKKPLKKAVHQAKPTHVIHLAAIPIATVAKKLPKKMREINLMGTINILEALRGISVRRFVYASSSMVYGNFKYEPADEEHPTNPIDIYGDTKLMGEQLTKSYARELGIEYVIIRPSAVYGYTDTNRRVTGIFMEHAVLKKPVFLENGGKEKLDFTYVKDLARGFVLALTKPQAKNQIFNMTRGQARSINELYKIINSIVPLKMTHRKSAIERPSRGGLDISKARRMLGYNPKWSLERGIKKSIESYQNYYRRVK